ncbi:MAG: F0F1 ATP synthase subunit delta [Pseudomonadota bacterium]|nr:F0F1 ATP synthase subunit delta [Pseudomonadota bacterium]
MAELRTLARPYARAGFEAANQADNLQLWADQLNQLAIISGQPKVAAMIASTNMLASEQANNLNELLGVDAGSAMANFLQLLAENKRLSLLPSVAELFAELKANQEKSVDVTINTAFELDDEMKSHLASALKTKLQRDVQVSTAVDRSLIGGIVIRAGDIVIDGSVKGRLAKLAEAISI